MLAAACTAIRAPASAGDRAGSRTRWSRSPSRRSRRRTRARRAAGRGCPRERRGPAHARVRGLAAPGPRCARRPRRRACPRSRRRRWRARRRPASRLATSAAGHQRADDEAHLQQHRIQRERALAEHGSATRSDHSVRMHDESAGNVAPRQRRRSPPARRRRRRRLAATTSATRASGFEGGGRHEHGGLPEPVDQPPLHRQRDRRGDPDARLDHAGDRERARLVADQEDRRQREGGDRQPPDEAPRAIGTRARRMAQQALVRRWN